MGPTVAIGVTSTGTAISTLGGATATNAVLAWLGGGALVTSGGGMATGEAFFGLSGPIGWTLAGIVLIINGLFFWKSKSELKLYLFRSVIEMLRHIIVR